jgi:hypothetical protein
MGALQNFILQRARWKKQLLGAKTTPQISRHRRETAAFSGFYKPEDRLDWRFLLFCGRALSLARKRAGEDIGHF